VGSSSPLDGKKALRCLACRTTLQPRRPKPLYAFFFVLALCVTVAAAAFSLYKISGGEVVPALRGLFATGVCAWAMFLIRRTLTATVPVQFDTREFPNPHVQLTAMTVRTAVSPEREWTQGLGAFVTEVMRSAGRCLSEARSTYKVCLKLEIVAGVRKTTLSYRGKPPEAALSALLDEIERLPKFSTPDEPISLELWFDVKA
jgi:hypothetical protein